MSGKRILDLAALVNASHGVAQKHVALRTRQLDLYHRTSKVTQAIQSQTDRVTVTIKAASFLARRLNEQSPAKPRSTSEIEPQDGGPVTQGPLSGRASNANSTDATIKDEVQHGESNNKDSGLGRIPQNVLEIRQETAADYPLPDGTILDNKSKLHPHKIGDSRNEGFRPAPWGNTRSPIAHVSPTTTNSRSVAQRQPELQIPSSTAYYPENRAKVPAVEGHDEDSFYSPPEHASPTLSPLPRVKIPRHTASVQDGDGSVQGRELNPDTFYGGLKHMKVPSSEAVLDQEQSVRDVNTDIFHSPRVAKLLGMNAGAAKIPDLQLKQAEIASAEETSFYSIKEPETFTAGKSPQREPAIPQDAQKLQNSSTYNVRNLTDTKPELRTPDATLSGRIEANLPPPHYELRESKVPSSRIGRLWNYGGLAAGMFGGAISESLRRVSGNGGEGSYMLSAGNMDRLVAKLSRMRGAALKLGQMISFQDSKMLPVAIQEVLQRVQDRADYMPPAQRDKVLASNLGTNWRDLFIRFDEKPLAAASIGQVHYAVLKSNGVGVAVKIQYPGVADSIDSDLNNLALLLTASRLLPKGLFLDKTIANARTELAWECDYIREAESCGRFHALLSNEADVFVVPNLFPEASGKQVLTMEFMGGMGVTKIQNFSQEQRDWIGTQILRLCLMEIIEFRFMQTDPNWTNFLYNGATNKLELLDFGASREYSKEFITAYTELLVAASYSDKEIVRAKSIQLGYLTGGESKAMMEAHIASVLTLAEPFMATSPEVYDFKDQTITERVKALIPVMIKERLVPPPEETYSLHRKLSGAFLLCARLGSRVRCRELFSKSLSKAGF